MWLIIGLFFVFVISLSIAYGQWLLLSVILIPLLIYFFLYNPFVFPLGLYVFLLPLDSLLSVTESSEGMKITKIIGILSILVFGLKGAFEKKLIQPNKAVICWILFMSYGLLSIIWAIDPTIAQNRFSTAIGLLLLYIVVSSYKIEKNEFNVIKKLIIAGGLLAAVVIIYNYLSGINFVGERVTLKFGEASSNPNLLGFSLLIPIAVCIEAMFNQNKKIKIIFFSIVLALMLLGIILTGSRGSMLGVGAIFIVYFFSTKKKFAFVTIAIIFGIILLPFIPDFYMQRWETSIETGGTGRTSIWYAGLMVAKKYWLIGAGLNNFPLAFNEFADYATATKSRFRDPHNTYMSILSELGIVGFILAIFGVWRHYQIIKRRCPEIHQNTQIMLKAAFCAILISSFFGSYLWKKSFWLLWMMILMYQNLVETELNKATNIARKYLHALSQYR
jgi:O-antigen ligase